MKVVTLAIFVCLAVVGETHFRLPTLTSLFSGFRPLLLSFPRFQPRPPQRPSLRLAGQYIQSPQQTLRHQPEVFSPVEVQTIIRQQQTHQPAGFSSSFISPILTTPAHRPSHIAEDFHHQSSRTVPQSHHQPDLHSTQPTKSSFRVVKSPAKTIKPTNRHGFEPLRPGSILSTEKPFQTIENGIITNIIKHDYNERIKSIVNTKFASNTKVYNGQNNIEHSSFPEPLVLINDNNIIGMFPPPPPPSLQLQYVLSQPSSSNLSQPKSLSQPPTMPVSLLPPPPPPFSIPKSNGLPQPPPQTKPPSNMSLFLLNPTSSSITSSPTQSPISNGLPVLNAGVLPLADESSTNFVAFPPFGNFEKLKDEQKLQELFPPFPPNDILFTAS